MAEPTIVSERDVNQAETAGATATKPAGWQPALILFVAQGFGAGRSPIMPGTAGTLLGLGWGILLAGCGSLLMFWLGSFLGWFASVWFCGRAEEILCHVDPPSVVLDEIIAMPFCFAAWMGVAAAGEGALPTWSSFFEGSGFLGLLGIFLGFRIFDIWKPWPLRQLQSLHGGWGVTTDDVLAAGYVNVMTLLAVAVLGTRV